MQHGLQGRPVLSVVAARPRRGRRDDRDGRYASTTRHTRMESVLAAKGGNTMVRKVIIALAAVVDAATEPTNVTAANAIMT